MTSAKPMNVLHLSTTLPWGGGQQQILLLVQGLIREGLQPHVAAPKRCALATRLPGRVPVLPISAHGAAVLASAFRVARYCRAHDIDVLHAHTGGAHTTALLALLFGAGCPVVVHRRIASRPKGRFKFFHPRVRAYIAISEAIVARLREIGVPSDRIHLVYSSVDPEPFRRAAASGMRERLRRDMGWPAGLPVIGTAARLDPAKGVDVLVGAMALLRPAVECGCVVAGEGEDRGRLQDLIARHKLEDRVRLLGERRDIPELLSALDIFAMPSLKEGLGSAVIESFQAGCCAVATRVGGLPELVRHEETGLLVEPGDPAPLAAALRRLLDDPALRRRLAEAGRRVAAERFDPDTMVRATLAVYERVCPK